MEVVYGMMVRVPPESTKQKEKSVPSFGNLTAQNFQKGQLGKVSAVKL